MKRNIIYSCISAFFIIISGINPLTARGQEVEKPTLKVTVSYFTTDNKVPYLTVATKAKIDGKFQPVSKAEVKLYLDKDSTGKGIGFIGKVVTDEKGKAATLIPPTLASVWKASANHTFIAVTDKTKQFDETNTELAIAKARITVDTADDKNVVATVCEYNGDAWVPVKGVDVKLGIKRQGGDLQIGEEQSYTTDSLGKVKGEFKKLKLPGDNLGNIVLVAKVEDNDQFGNLRVERATPWGVKVAGNRDFFHRALWASQFHSPVWLVFLAYSIVISVWGTLIYLVFMLIKIKKLGKEEERLS
jgi:hypothetical protein